MKKFVFIYTGSSAKGGLSTYYINLFENYPKSSNKITLVSFGDWSMPKELQAKGYRVVRFSKNIFGVLQFARFLKKEGVNLIVTGGVLSNFIGRITAGKIPVVTVIHSMFKTDYPNDAKRVIWDLINRVYSSRTKKYIVVSEFLKQSLIRDGIEPKKISVIYNGIEAMEPVTIKKHVDFNIVSVGRLHRTKGFDRLVHVAKYLPDKYQIKIWGDGEERKNLEYLIENNNLAKKVCLCGASEDIKTALSDADLYVQTSRMEGFGLAAAEAMMLEVPVAVTPTGALPELVENGKTGIVFKNEDPKEIAEEILKASENRELLKKLAKAGRVSAMKRFEVDAWAKSVDNLLEEVVG